MITRGATSCVNIHQLKSWNTLGQLSFTVQLRFILNKILLYMYTSIDWKKIYFEDPVDIGSPLASVAIDGRKQATK